MSTYKDKLTGVGTQKPVSTLEPITDSEHVLEFTDNVKKSRERKQEANLYGHHHHHGKFKKNLLKQSSTVDENEKILEYKDRVQNSFSGEKENDNIVTQIDKKVSNRKIHKATDLFAQKDKKESLDEEKEESSETKESKENTNGSNNIVDKGVIPTPLPPEQRPQELPPPENGEPKPLPPVEEDEPKPLPTIRDPPIVLSASSQELEKKEPRKRKEKCARDVRHVKYWLHEAVDKRPPRKYQEEIVDETLPEPGVWTKEGIDKFFMEKPIVRKSSKKEECPVPSDEKQEIQDNQEQDQEEFSKESEEEITIPDVLKTKPRAPNAKTQSTRSNVRDSTQTSSSTEGGSFDANAEASEESSASSSASSFVTGSSDQPMTLVRKERTRSMKLRHILYDRIKTDSIVKGLVVGADTRPENFDIATATSKFLTVQLNPEKLKCTVWSRLFSDVFGGAKNLNIDSILTPRQWDMFFQRVFLEFEIDTKTSVVTFDPKSKRPAKETMPLFVAFGLKLFSDFNIGPDDWLPLFFFVNLRDKCIKVQGIDHPISAIQCIVGSRAWSERRLDIKEKQTLLDLIEFLSGVELKTHNMLVSEWLVLLTQIHVTLKPPSSKKTDNGQKNREGAQGSTRQVCLPPGAKKVPPISASDLFKGCPDQPGRFERTRASDKPLNRTKKDTTEDAAVVNVRPRTPPRAQQRQEQNQGQRQGQRQEQNQQNQRQQQEQNQQNQGQQQEETRESFGDSSVQISNEKFSGTKSDVIPSKILDTEPTVIRSINNGDPLKFTSGSTKSPFVQPNHITSINQVKLPETSSEIPQHTIKSVYPIERQEKLPKNSFTREKTFQKTERSFAQVTANGYPNGASQQNDFPKTGPQGLGDRGYRGYSMYPAMKGYGQMNIASELNSALSNDENNCIKVTVDSDKERKEEKGESLGNISMSSKNLEAIDKKVRLFGQQRDQHEEKTLQVLTRTETLKSFGKQIGSKPFVTPNNQAKQWLMVMLSSDDKFRSHMLQQYGNKGVDIMNIDAMIQYKKNGTGTENIFPWEKLNLEEDWACILHVFDFDPKVVKDEDLGSMPGFESIEKFYKYMQEYLPERKMNWSNAEKIKRFLTIYAADNKKWQKLWKVCGYELKPYIKEAIEKFIKENPGIDDATTQLVFTIISHK